ncbi:hypothetical protein HU200_057468 [Digitaria exilis]|uniref:Uncharacterized protein n=1 Tax=Digitaria exilis TaxID=1010633 RepID=A0A835AJZ9_9POAL|nr:hypothetical protein HU200_057468 [Digitaria exilis]
MATLEATSFIVSPELGGALVKCRVRAVVQALVLPASCATRSDVSFTPGKDGEVARFPAHCGA